MEKANAKDKAGEIIRPFLYFIKPYPFFISFLILLIVMASLMEGLNIVALFGLLNIVLSADGGGGQVSGGNLTYFLTGLINLFPFSNKIISIMVIFFAITLIKCFFDFIRKYFTCLVSSKIWHDVQYRVFSKFLSADYQFFLDNKEGELLYRGFTAPSVMGVTLQYGCEFAAEIVKLIIILAVLFTISFKFSAVIVVFSGVFYLFTHIIAQKITYYLGRQRRDASMGQTVILTELVNGIKQIKVFLSEKKWLKNYDQVLKSYFRYYVKDETWQHVPPTALELMAVGLLGLLFVISGGFNLSGVSKSYISVFAVYIYSFYRFMPSLKSLSAKKMSYTGNLSIIESLYNFCREKLDNIPDGNKRLPAFNDSLRFERVDFGYPDRKQVLTGLNLEIKKGQTTAIVGKSGSGKTTLINLILRLFVPQSGRILVDGTDLRELKLENWLSRTGYVSQETFIFNGTIRENIVFGRPDDESRLIAAAEMANISEFILNLPDRYEALVGDKGLKLSGGQRQRIAIARAMYGSPEILIFDEATSSLDNLSERLIQQSIRQISANHTVILVAHRLSTVINSDKIIVLDNGKIVGEGSHSELMDAGGIYRKLYNSDLTLEKTS